MPKSTRATAPKKARWTAAQKATVKRGPKKPHRGQSATSSTTPYAARSPRPAVSGPARGERAGGAERPARREDGPRREFQRREDGPRREFQRREDGPRREFQRREDGPRREFQRREDGPRREFQRREDGPRREFQRREDGPRREFQRREDFPRPERRPDAEAERLAADTWTKATRRPSRGPVVVDPDNGFAALGLPQVLVERLARDGITAPFPIQSATIPDALAGRDVLGRGQTGSGKTLAFGLPTLVHLSDGVRATSRRPRALVLVPTRELAMQVSDALEPLVHALGLRHKLVAGGLSYTTQIAALDRGVELLIATPGRLRDLLDRRAVDLGAIEVTILDEADHMADMGFLPEVTAILDEAPAEGQRLLFSATLDKGVDQIVARYLTDPVTHSTDDATASVETMEHHVLLIDPIHKKTVTAEVANRSGRTVVFVRTKLGADRIATQLREQGIFAAALHGGLSQGVRNRVLGAFRDGTLPVLVATDVAARGIHVDDVSVVLQVDPPADHKDYLHRAGRTARAGERGTVVTLALPHQRRPVERLVATAGVDVAAVRVSPGDAVLAATGASTPSGVPVPEETVRRLLEGERRPSRGRGPGRGQGRPSHAGPRGGRRPTGGRPRG